MLHATEEILVLAHIVFNGLQGFIILTIFTMNERVLKLYKDGLRKWRKSRNRKVLQGLNTIHSCLPKLNLIFFRYREKVVYQRS